MLRGKEEEEKLEEAKDGRRGREALMDRKDR